MPVDFNEQKAAVLTLATPEFVRISLILDSILM